MSEYQYVTFRAVDSPVSAENLGFMRKQSSRAEITRQSFTNTYEYGDFHGDVVGMLRRGYDIHLHYADFGIRKLALRLPLGLPDITVAQDYVANNVDLYQADEGGEGGILTIDPSHEPGDQDCDEDLEDTLERLIPLRQEIREGDLRPLYLAHFIECVDENHNPNEIFEAPVPAGMAQLSPAQRALAEFYRLDASLLAAIAESSPRLSQTSPASNHYLAWLKTLSEEKKDAWLEKMMSDQYVATRNQLLAEFQRDQPHPTWPVNRQVRTIAEITSRGDAIRHERKLEAEARKEREQAKRLAEMASSPQQFLSEVNRLVTQQNTRAYDQAARLLAELRTALADTQHFQLATDHAFSLQKSHPNYRGLAAALKREGFLRKR